MPQKRDPDREAARVTAHAGIEGLIDTLVPSLIAKLATLNVGELEVREDDWHIRLRRPSGAVQDFARRSTDRVGQRGHAGHDGVGSPGPARTSGGTVTTTGGASSNGSLPALAPVGPGHAGDAAHPADEGRTSPAPAPTATSPAVGIFQPGPPAVGGTRVRAGDRLGVVNMLGIPQDVLAPTDGIVISVLVEGGTAVEYGQELIHIEATTVAEAH